MRFIIQDWSGIRKFPDREFTQPADAQAFLDERFPDETDRGEFYVVQAGVSDSERLDSLPLFKDLGSRLIDDELLMMSVRRSGNAYVGCCWGMHTRLYVSASYDSPEKAQADVEQRFIRRR